MGDRGNVVVRQQPHDVYLYTHWSGSYLPEIVRNALAKRWRWTDPAYLTRIIFDEMTKKCHGEETGFGIATCEQDNENPIVYVDCGAQTVSIGGALSFTFEDYIKGVSVGQAEEV